MKQLKFDHGRALRLVAGPNNYTLRLIDDKDLRAGDEFRVVDKTSATNPAQWLILGQGQITATDIYSLGQLKRGEVPNGDFEDAADLLAVYRQSYNDDQQVDLPVKLVTFDYTPYESPEPYYEVVYNEPAGDKTSKVPGKVMLYADGGSRGNPGPSASGWAVFDEAKKPIASGSKYLGITTNNQAEYQALKIGLEWCLSNHVREVDVRMDSLLVVNQMKGIFKVRNRDLWPIHESIKQLTEQFQKISFSHVPRELNKEADAEVNKALDAEES
ncbi:ribonuclease HI family protein [Candidatus Saccharibacteria bacterium]|jgi:ribonuclease HI|nr:MAG: ribonuclease HI family protein [Candidatus Saccharibacteria bacterium]